MQKINRLMKYLHDRIREKISRKEQTLHLITMVLIISRITLKVCLPPPATSAIKRFLINFVKKKCEHF